MLVSEVMLQQTQAARVAPAFDRFLALFPSLAVLAAATRADVVRAWRGLGYNRRAVRLHQAAVTIVTDHHGRVPADDAALRSLPGIGAYTSAAIASLAFGAPVPALDTNVRRVLARALRGGEPADVPAATQRRDAERCIDRRDPGGWNSALMDLGRVVCRPIPRCDVCPIATSCAFRRAEHIARRSGRAQPAFEGSMRQLRGRIVDELRSEPAVAIDRLSRLGRYDAVRRALAALEADGLVAIEGDVARLYA